MELKVKFLGFSAGRPVAILNRKTAEVLSVYVNERVRIRNKHSIVAIVDITEKIVNENEVALSKEIIDILKIKEGSSIKVTTEPQPITTMYISEKLEGKELDDK